MDGSRDSYPRVGNERRSSFFVVEGFDEGVLLCEKWERDLSCCVRRGKKSRG